MITLIVGAVAVFYAVNLFMANSSQGNETTSLRLSQWSGYLAASDIHDFSPVVSSVSGSWTVPRVQPSENDTFSGVWVGIGGYGEETLIQVGTEQEYINGRATYYAWYELLPDYLVPIPRLHVRAGDNITASISLINENASIWSIEINDVTRGEHYEKEVVYNSSKLSAEWIVERPKVNDSISMLADFGNVTLTDCKATLNGVTDAIGNFSYAHLVMHDDDSTSLVSVSPLDADGSGFTVSYLEQSNPNSTLSTIHTFNNNLYAPLPQTNLKQEYSDSA